jgi:hypothetical protein
MFNSEGFGTVDGAAYKPVALIAPRLEVVSALGFMLHVTDAFEVPPTVAVNCCVPFGASVAPGGVIEIVMFGAGAGVGAGVSGVGLGVGFDGAAGALEPPQAIKKHTALSTAATRNRRFASIVVLELSRFMRSEVLARLKTLPETSRFEQRQRG